MAESGTGFRIVPTIHRVEGRRQYHVRQLAAFTALTTNDSADLLVVEHINHVYAHTAFKPLPPVMLIKKLIIKTIKLLHCVLFLIAQKTYT